MILPFKLKLKLKNHYRTASTCRKLRNMKWLGERPLVIIFAIWSLFGMKQSYKSLWTTTTLSQTKWKSIWTCLVHSLKTELEVRYVNSSVVTPKGRRLDSHTSFWLSNPTCAGCHRRKSKFLILIFELCTKNISSCWNVESNPLLISNYF